ncbi:MAG: YraN family protein [Bacteroidales bacterium]|nr:YraN family protein [Bacteroidales bacterium]
MKAPTTAQNIGKQGEHLAARFLENLGYTIIATNWRYSYYEIDLIAQDGNILVVVEVKSRSSEQFSHPEDSVDRKKRGKLIKAAEAYIFNNNYMGELRFDIISIVFGNQEPQIYHIKDAFYPGLF